MCVCVGWGGEEFSKKGGGEGRIHEEGGRGKREEEREKPGSIRMEEESR